MIKARTTSNGTRCESSITTAESIARKDNQHALYRDLEFRVGTLRTSCSHSSSVQTDIQARISCSRKPEGCVHSCYPVQIVNEEKECCDVTRDGHWDKDVPSHPAQSYYIHCHYPTSAGGTDTLSASENEFKASVSRSFKKKVTDKFPNFLKGRRTNTKKLNRPSLRKEPLPGVGFHQPPWEVVEVEAWPETKPRTPELEGSSKSMETAQAEETLCSIYAELDGTPCEVTRPCKTSFGEASRNVDSIKGVDYAALKRKDPHIHQRHRHPIDTELFGGELDDAVGESLPVYQSVGEGMPQMQDRTFSPVHSDTSLMSPVSPMDDVEWMRRANTEIQSSSHLGAYPVISPTSSVEGASALHASTSVPLQHPSIHDDWWMSKQDTKVEESLCFSTSALSPSLSHSSTSTSTSIPLPPMSMPSQETSVNDDWWIQSNLGTPCTNSPPLPGMMTYTLHQVTPMTSEQSFVISSSQHKEPNVDTRVVVADGLEELRPCTSSSSPSIIDCSSPNHLCSLMFQRVLPVDDLSSHSFQYFIRKTLTLTAKTLLEKVPPESKVSLLSRHASAETVLQAGVHAVQKMLSGAVLREAEDFSTLIILTWTTLLVLHNEQDFQKYAHEVSVDLIAMIDSINGYKQQNLLLQWLREWKSYLVRSATATAAGSEAKYRDYPGRRLDEENRIGSSCKPRDEFALIESRAYQLCFLLSTGGFEYVGERAQPGLNTITTTPGGLCLRVCVRLLIGNLSVRTHIMSQA
jgi:hypothetical protein